MPIVPSLPTKHPPQVEARLVGLEPTQPGGGSVTQYDVERAHVRRGHARREAVRAAGVGGHVAADRARLL
jgi:hypothetical protein